jgi:hypothetical protein
VPTDGQSSGRLQKLPFLTALFLILGQRSYWTGSFTWPIFNYLFIYYYYYFGIVSTGEFFGSSNSISFLLNDRCNVVSFVIMVSFVIS